MRVSAKADYAVRAAAELAAAGDEGPVKGERLADAQDIPLQFLEHILLEIRNAGIIGAAALSLGVEPDLEETVTGQ